MSGSQLRRRRKEGEPMTPVVYALFAYALTSIISFLVIGIVVAINLVVSRKDAAGTQKEGE